MNREKELQWYRDYIVRNKNSSWRRVREYVRYLERWFSPEYMVDGANYETRIKYRTPQTPNGYMFE